MLLQKRAQNWPQSTAISLIIDVCNALVYSGLQQLTTVGEMAVSVAVNRRVIGCRLIE
jgi:hypothetical protein